MYFFTMYLAEHSVINLYKNCYIVLWKLQCSLYRFFFFLIYAKYLVVILFTKGRLFCYYLLLPIINRLTLKECTIVFVFINFRKTLPLYVSENLITNNLNCLTSCYVTGDYHKELYKLWIRIYHYILVWCVLYKLWTKLILHCYHRTCISKQLSEKFPRLWSSRETYFL